LISAGIFDELFLLENKSCVKIIDLFNNSPFGNHDFLDTDHMNIDGAKKLSKILNKYL